jgi:hypothetical protein
MTPDPESVSIYDWAVTANLQPEPISVEVWRNLPEEFCRQVELVDGQVVRCEKPTRAHRVRVLPLAALRLVHSSATLPGGGNGNPAPARRA